MPGIIRSVMTRLKSIKAEYYLLALILLFALFIRVYALGNPPFWIDESISSIAAKNIVEKGLPVLDSGMHYDGSLAFQYPVALSFLLLGFNEFAARLVSVILGLLTIILAYFIGKEYSKSGGIISALFFAVFYLEVFYSRQARHYQLFQLLFFLSLFLLYKSITNKKLILPALIALVLAIDTQPSGWLLVPVFAIHFIIHRKTFFGRESIIQRSLSQKNIFKYIFFGMIAAFIIYKLVSILIYASSYSWRMALSYAMGYLGYLDSLKYLLLIFIVGLVVAFFIQKKLTIYIMLPALALLFGTFFVKFFAFRYVYFFIFALLLYSAVLLAVLYDKCGKVMLIPIILLLLVPSNIFFPYNYVNALKPVLYNHNDVSSPEIDYKNMPAELIDSLRNNTVIVFFSPSFEWYVKKPDYVLPFSMNGVEPDSVSWNGVDRYSGAPMLLGNASKPYYLVADSFSVYKLNKEQKEHLQRLTSGCVVEYESRDYKVYWCE